WLARSHGRVHDGVAERRPCGLTGLNARNHRNGSGINVENPQTRCRVATDDEDLPAVAREASDLAVACPHRRARWLAVQKLRVEEGVVGANGQSEPCWKRDRRRSWRRYGRHDGAWVDWISRVRTRRDA